MIHPLVRDLASDGIPGTLTFLRANHSAQG